MELLLLLNFKLVLNFKHSRELARKRLELGANFRVDDVRPVFERLKPHLDTMATTGAAISPIDSDFFDAMKELTAEKLHSEYMAMDNAKLEARAGATVVPAA